MSINTEHKLVKDLAAKAGVEADAVLKILKQLGLSAVEKELADLGLSNRVNIDTAKIAFKVGRSHIAV